MWDIHLLVFIQFFLRLSECGMHYEQLGVFCAFIILMCWYIQPLCSPGLTLAWMSFCEVLNRFLNPKLIVETRVINLCPPGSTLRWDMQCNHRPLHYVCFTVCKWKCNSELRVDKNEFDVFRQGTLICIAHFCNRQFKVITKHKQVANFFFSNITIKTHHHKILEQRLESICAPVSNQRKNLN